MATCVKCFNIVKKGTKTIEVVPPHLLWFCLGWSLFKWPAVPANAKLVELVIKKVLIFLFLQKGWKTRGDSIYIPRVIEVIEFASDG